MFNTPWNGEESLLSSCLDTIRYSFNLPMGYLTREKIMFLELPTKRLLFTKRFLGEGMSNKTTNPCMGLRIGSNNTMEASGGRGVEVWALRNGRLAGLKAIDVFPCVRVIVREFVGTNAHYTTVLLMQLQDVVGELAGEQSAHAGIVGGCRPKRSWIGPQWVQVDVVENIEDAGTEQLGDGQQSIPKCCLVTSPTRRHKRGSVPIFDLTPRREPRMLGRDSTII